MMPHEIGDVLRHRLTFDIAPRLNFGGNLR